MSDETKRIAPGERLVVTLARPRRERSRGRAREADEETAARGVAPADDEEGRYLRRRPRADVQLYNLGTRIDPQSGRYFTIPALAEIKPTNIFGTWHEQIADPFRDALLDTSPDPFGYTELDEGGRVANCAPLDFASEYRMIDLLTARDDYAAGEEGKRPSARALVELADEGTPLVVEEAEGSPRWVRRETPAGDAGEFARVKIERERFRVVSYGPLQSLFPFEPRLFRVTRQPHQNAAEVRLPASKSYRVFLAPRILQIAITYTIEEGDGFTLAGAVFGCMPSLDPRGKFFSYTSEAGRDEAAPGAYPAALFDLLRNEPAGASGVGPGHVDDFFGLPANRLYALPNYFALREWHELIVAADAWPELFLPIGFGGATTPTVPGFDGSFWASDLGLAAAPESQFLSGDLQQRSLAGVVETADGERFYCWLAPKSAESPAESGYYHGGSPDPFFIFDWQLFGQLSHAGRGIVPIARFVGEFPFDHPAGLVTNAGHAAQDFDLEFDALP